MSAPWFRTTDMLRWGAANSGGDLAAVMFDENTWYFQSKVTALEARPIAVGIAYFTLVGDQLTVVMEDHTTRGPYTIPISAFKFRGDWIPDNVYIVNDVTAANGQIYIVIFNHVSQSVFDPDASDGLGHKYYALMLSTPGNALPTGGAAGQVLAKSTSVDYAVTWAWALPTGGSTDQILMKDSNTNQDANWRTSPFVWAPPPSPPGVAGYVLSTVDGTSSNTVWVAQSGGGGGGSIATLSDVAYVTGDPQFGAVLAFDSVDWRPTAEPLNGQTLKFDGSVWVPTDLSFPNIFGNLTPTQTKRGYTTFTNIGNNISGTVTMNPGDDSLFQATPNGNLTINASGVWDAGEFSILFYHFTGVLCTVTFGTHFKTTGTLSVGSGSNNQTVIKFLTDGSTCYELSRSGPY